MTDRSIYVFAEGYDGDWRELVKEPGIRFAATLAHPTWGLFIAGWEGGTGWSKVLPPLPELLVVFWEPDPRPDYQARYPGCLKWFPPSEKAYHALSVEWTLPESPFLEEAALTVGGNELCLWGAEWREEILAVATSPFFVTAFAYEDQDALVR